MNKSDIERLAKQHGFVPSPALLAFARAIAEQERNECIAICATRQSYIDIVEKLRQRKEPEND